MENLRSRWLNLMEQLGFQANEAALKSVISSYTESHRHYHTLGHIEDCLQYFDTLRDAAANPSEIELALWYHDLIYSPFKANNEQRSAEQAITFLQSNEAEKEVCDRVFRLIMATKHGLPASTADEALLVDIDLAILGAPNDVYEKFEINIRKEYRWVPSFTYRKKRRQLLQAFLDRRHIYNNLQMRETLEAQARSNLERAISNL